MQIINDTLPALAKLRKEGTVRYVGFSGLPLDAFTYILDRLAHGPVLQFFCVTLALDRLNSLLEEMPATAIRHLCNEVLASTAPGA